MTVAAITEINRRLRLQGITVHEAPGWKTRGVTMDVDYVGGILHHTASGYAIALPGTGIYDLLFTKGRTGKNPLGPPLCNYAGNDDGSFTCGAAGSGNHAGSSGLESKSLGPLPMTRSFNRRVIGLEIIYPGDRPMTAAQHRSAVIWSRAVADVVGGGNVESIRAHAETSETGKWDPGEDDGETIDMAAFRREVAALKGARGVTTPYQNWTFLHAKDPRNVYDILREAEEDTSRIRAMLGAAEWQELPSEVADLRADLAASTSRLDALEGTISDVSAGIAQILAKLDQQPQ